jgi:RNA polymerase sigma factor (sigma-70 family)
MTDEDDIWLRELRSSDSFIRDNAISRLRELLLRGLTRSLTNRYGQPFSAEDVVQDALLKILASLDQFEGRSRFLTWSMTVATRIGISKLRRKFHQDVSMEAFQQNDDRFQIEVPGDELSEESQQQERHNLLSTLQNLIDNELTEKQRLAIRAFLAGFSTDGIAERIGANRNSVYKLIHDARQKLKNGFLNAGISAEDIRDAFA